MMKILFKMPFFLLFFQFYYCGDDMSPDGECKNVVKIINENGKLHGEGCLSDNECKYGRCVNAPIVTGGAFKICTKDCTCGALSECDDDNTENGTYQCMRLSPSDPEPITNMCVPICPGEDFCKSINEKYSCDYPLKGTARKTCLVK